MRNGRGDPWPGGSLLSARPTPCATWLPHDAETIVAGTYYLPGPPHTLAHSARDKIFLSEND